MKLVYSTWADYKTEILSKGFPYNHQTLRNESGVINGYMVFVIDRTSEFVCDISDPSDITDFETNYKSNSNRNITYGIGGYTTSGYTLSMRATYRMI